MDVDFPVHATTVAMTSFYSKGAYIDYKNNFI